MFLSIRPLYIRNILNFSLNSIALPKYLIYNYISICDLDLFNDQDHIITTDHDSIHQYYHIKGGIVP